MRSTFMFRLPAYTRAPFDAVDQDSSCKIWTRRRAEMLVWEVTFGATVRVMRSWDANQKSEHDTTRAMSAATPQLL